MHTVASTAVARDLVTEAGAFPPVPFLDRRRGTLKKRIARAARTGGTAGRGGGHERHGEQQGEPGGERYCGRSTSWTIICVLAITPTPSVMFV